MTIHTKDELIETVDQVLHQIDMSGIESPLAEAMKLMLIHDRDRAIERLEERNDR